MHSFQQRGMVSVIILLLIMLFLAMGLAFSKVAVTEVKMAKINQEGAAAQFIAEAGIHKAIYSLQNDPDWNGIGPEYLNHGNTLGSLMVKIYKNSVKPDFTVIQSTGRVGSAERIVSFAYVTPPGGGELSVYGYSLFAGNILNVEDASGLDVNKIGCCKAVYVAGKLLEGCSYQEKVRIPAVPTLADRWIQDRILAKPPAGRSSSYTVPLSGRVYLYKHRYNFPYTVQPYHTISGNGVIYSAEAIDIGEHVQIPQRIVVVSESSIFIHKNAVLNKALLVARQNIYIEPGVIFTGCAVAGNEIEVKSGTKINYDAAVRSIIQTNYWLN